MSAIVLLRALDAIERYQRMSPARTHKASSAESVLRHCLRTRGWTAAFRRGKLTGQQHLDLCEDVRQYGRAWLRHEAEGLLRHEGRTDVVRLLPAGPGPFPGPADRSLAGRVRHGVDRFFRRARGFVRELIVAGAMALCGPELAEADLDEATRQAAVQERYFDNFEVNVVVSPPVELGGEPTANPMTGPQLVARAEMYGNAGWQAAQHINRGRAGRNGAVRERRIHRHPNPEIHACATCRAASDAGWQPVGALPAIGDSECLNSCDCYFAFELADGSIYITSRGWS